MIVDLFDGPGISVTDAGCWIGLGTANGNGYTSIRISGKKHYVHRLSYEVHVGPIPQGLVIDHLCRNRACFNPEHLEPVSNEENIARGESPPAQNARKVRCPHGHDYTLGADGTRRCLVCRRERRIATGEINGRGLPADRTHCPSGHPYDDENTYLVRRPDGSIKQRMCRECGRARVRARRAARKGGDAQ